MSISSNLSIIFFILLTLCVQSQGQSKEYTYEMFMEQFGRNYTGDEKLIH